MVERRDPSLAATTAFTQEAGLSTLATPSLNRAAASSTTGTQRVNTLRSRPT